MSFHWEESDGIILISALIAMTKLKAHLDFLDEEQATELVERFGKKRRGRATNAKGINFLQSILNITDKGILQLLQDIPMFETDSNLVRVNSLIIITYIAHKLRAEYLWQRYLFKLRCPKILL